MYNVKEFNELETMAQKEGVYVDPQLVTATPNFAAATCTVSNKDGRRIFRAVSGTSVAVVTEQAIALALCAYYEKPIPAPYAVENVYFPTEPLAKTSSVVPGKESELQEKTGATQRNQNGSKAVDNPSAEEKSDEKAIQTPIVGGTDKEKKETAKNDTATNTQVSAGSTGSAAGGAEDFQVMVGKYRTRSDNYIKQMLETEDGREFLTKIIHIGSPSAQIKPYVDKTKAYLDSYGIQL